MAVCLSGYHYSVCNSQTSETERGESVFPLRESERKEMWLGTENESICMCMWTQILPTFKAILYRWGDLEGPTSTICWTSHHSCSRTQKFQENESFFMSQPITFTHYLMSSFPFLCSGREPRQRESFPFKLRDLRLIRRVHTHRFSLEYRCSSGLKCSPVY